MPSPEDIEQHSQLLRRLDYSTLDLRAPRLRYFLYSCASRMTLDQLSRFMEEERPAPQPRARLIDSPLERANGGEVTPDSPHHGRERLNQVLEEIRVRQTERTMRAVFYSSFMSDARYPVWGEATHLLAPHSPAPRDETMNPESEDRG